MHDHWSRSRTLQIKLICQYWIWSWLLMIKSIHTCEMLSHHWWSWMNTVAVEMSNRKRQKYYDWMKSDNDLMIFCSFRFLQKNDPYISKFLSNPLEICSQCALLFARYKVVVYFNFRLRLHGINAIGKAKLINIWK